MMTALATAETAYIKHRYSVSAEDVAIIKAYVAVSGVYLPAFYNETPFIRHSIFTDDVSVFSHDPFMMDSSFGSIVYGKVYQ